jgi:flagellar assembly factor FliW
MTFEHHQFGLLEFEEEHVIRFPDGLIGFPGSQSYLVINEEETEPFRWLVSISDPDVAFPLLDPLLLLPSYPVDMDEKTTVFLVAVLHDDPSRSRANARSPIVVDNTTRVGKQIILDDESYPLMMPLVVTAEGGA